MDSGLSAVETERMEEEKARPGGRANSMVLLNGWYKWKFGKKRRG